MRRRRYAKPASSARAGFCSSPVRWCWCRSVSPRPRTQGKAMPRTCGWRARCCRSWRGCGRRLETGLRITWWWIRRSVGVSVSRLPPPAPPPSPAVASDGRSHSLSDVLPLLTGARWPEIAYAREQLPERVLQFGSGMLLRALCAAAVDSANRAGKQAGRIVVVQSTADGAARARALNAQDGLYTLVERGLSGGAPFERFSLIGASSRALAADSQWNAVRDVAARPEMQVIVSNVSEAGFRIDAPFPVRLTDALHARFTRAPDAPPVFVIPTELVPDNGPRLAAMVDELAGKYDNSFRDWLEARVRFCSSLVD